MSCLLSVLIPAHNEESFIKSCVDSIRTAIRGRGEAEIIIGDDGSTDSTREIAARMASNDPRIRVITHQSGRRQGVGKTRNLCLSVSQGKLVCFLDADDLMLPNRFDKSLAILRDKPEIDGVAEAVAVIFADEPSLTAWKNDWTLFTHDPGIAADDFLAASFDGRSRMLTGGLIVRRSLFHKAGVYTNRALSEDFHLWLRMAACGRFAVGEIEKPVVLYRRHAGNTSRWDKHVSFRDLAVVGEVLSWAKKNPDVWIKNRRVLETAFRNKLAYCQQMALDEGLVKEGIKAFVTGAICMPRLLSERRIWANIVKQFAAFMSMSAHRA